MKCLQLVAVVGTLAILLLYNAAQAQQGELTVTPAEGPVGTTVLLEGRGCNNPGQQILLVFQNGDEATGATVGAERVARDFAGDDRGQFKVNYTIPPEFQAGSLQGRGGGPLTLGVYHFVSGPPICQAPFTLTAPHLPETGGPGASASQFPLWLFGIPLAVGAAVVIYGLSIARRRRKTRP